MSPSTKAAILTALAAVGLIGLVASCFFEVHGPFEDPGDTIPLVAYVLVAGLALVILGFACFGLAVLFLSLRDHFTSDIKDEWSE